MTTGTPGRRGPSFILVGLCLVLAIVLYREITDAPRVPVVKLAAGPGKGVVPRGAVDTRIAFPPIDDFAEVVERPLFNDTRRPREPEEEAETPAPEIQTKFSLVGTVMSATEHVALIQRDQSKELVIIAEGENIDGWTVEAVHSDHVVVRNGDTQQVVELREPIPRRPPGRPPRKGQKRPQKRN